MTTPITITPPPAGLAPLYHRYQGQAYPCPAYVDIDTRTRTVFTTVNYEPDTKPAPVWEGERLWIPCPPDVRGGALREYLDRDDTRALLTAICDNPDNGELQDQLEGELDRLNPVDCQDVETWLEPAIGQIRRRLALGEAVEHVVRSLEATAESDGVLLWGNVREYVRRAIDYTQLMPVAFTERAESRILEFFTKYSLYPIVAEATIQEVFERVSDRVPGHNEPTYELGQHETKNNVPQSLSFGNDDFIWARRD